MFSLQGLRTAHLLIKKVGRVVCWHLRFLLALCLLDLCLLPRLSTPQSVSGLQPLSPTRAPVYVAGPTALGAQIRLALL